MSLVNFDENVFPVDELKVEVEREYTTSRGKQASPLKNQLSIKTPDGRRMLISPRFWDSFCHCFGISRSVFNLFEFDEVFNKLAEKTNANVRICAELFDNVNGHLQGRVLSCVDPKKMLLGVKDVENVLYRFSAKEIGYNNGEVTAMFDCPYPLQFSMGDSDFQTKFKMVIPIDGFGLPCSYLSMMRMVCSNGMVAEATGFRTQFQLAGDSYEQTFNTLERSLESFNNEEGFHALKERLEVAQVSWASLNNFLSLAKVLNLTNARVNLPTEARKRIETSLDTLGGNPMRVYGFRSASTPSARIARTLPIDCKVYDLINFATEVATHEYKAGERRYVDAWVGDLLASEYDLENTATQFTEFKDFFLRQ